VELRAIIALGTRLLDGGDEVIRSAMSELSCLQGFLRVMVVVVVVAMVVVIIAVVMIITAPFIVAFIVAPWWRCPEEPRRRLRDGVGQPPRHQHIDWR
jgi:Flp pilus assembly protein TadB